MLSLALRELFLNTSSGPASVEVCIGLRLFGAYIFEGKKNEYTIITHASTWNDLPVAVAREIPTHSLSLHYTSVSTGVKITRKDLFCHNI